MKKITSGITLRNLIGVPISVNLKEIIPVDNHALLNRGEYFIYKTTLYKYTDDNKLIAYDIRDIYDEVYDIRIKTEGDAFKCIDRLVEHIVKNYDLITFAEVNDKDTISLSIGTYHNITMIQPIQIIYPKSINATIKEEQVYSNIRFYNAYFAKKYPRFIVKGNDGKLYIDRATGIMHRIKTGNNDLLVFPCINDFTDPSQYCTTVYNLKNDMSITIPYMIEPISNNYDNFIIDYIQKYAILE